MNQYGFVSDVVHRETQRMDGGFDLTVDEIYVVDGRGRVDFGGGELEAAEVEAVATEKRDPDDDYGWWNLDGGSYLLEHNEGLEADAPEVEISTRRELLERGAYHPRVRTTELSKLPLTVVDGGVQVKENARVSTLRLP